MGCGQCDTFVPSTSVVWETHHHHTKQCQAGAEQKWKRLLELENLEAQEAVFTVNGMPLENVDSFKYLGRIITVDDSDGPSVLSNIHKVHGRWSQVAHL